MKSKIFKKLATAVLSGLTAASLMCNSVAYAEFSNIEKMGYRDRDDKILNILRDIENADLADLRDYAEYFTYDAYVEFSRYISDVGIAGGITFMVNDYIDVKNSSNSDFVVMSNLKTAFGDSFYLFLIELHFNVDGKIYGFNAWHY